MIYEKIDLYDEFALPKGKGAGGILTVFCRERSVEFGKKRRPAVLVIPGGAYWFLSAREIEPVALRFLDEGYTVFTLDYAVQTAYPAPLVEAAMAMAYIRKNAEKYDVDESHVAAVGFSAGGHLAGMLATLFDAEPVKTALKGDAKLVRPDAVVLSYPVITTEKGIAHDDSANNISGGDEELKRFLSLEKRVKKDSVPAFLWHTMEDDLVPVESSLLFASAYRKAGVPFELHIFEKGCHGLSVASRDTELSDEAVARAAHVAVWVDMALKWLEKRGFLVKTL